MNDTTKQFKRVKDNPAEINSSLMKENRKLYHQNAAMKAEIEQLKFMAKFPTSKVEANLMNKVDTLKKILRGLSK